MARDTENGHAYCLICGTRNPDSLGLCFRDVDASTVCARFQAHPRLQGYDGILHGGVVSALLDAAMTHCLFHRGVQAVTGDLRVRFLAPIPCDLALDVRGWIVSDTPPLYQLKAELLHDGRVLAWAQAKFVDREWSLDA